MLYVEKTGTLVIHSDIISNLDEKLSLLSEVKWIFLDFDGVLINSLGPLTDLGNHVLWKMGSPRDEYSNAHIFAVPEDSLTAPVMTWEGCAEHIGCTPDQSREYGRLCLEMVEDALATHPLETGMAVCLRKLVDRGRTVCILTGSSTKLVESILERNNLRHLIYKVMGRPDPHDRGKGEILRDFLTEYQLNPSDVVMVGDTISDGHAANFAGVPWIATTWGVHQMSVLAQAAPDFYAHDPEHLCALLTLESRSLPRLESLGFFY